MKYYGLGLAEKTSGLLHRRRNNMKRNQAISILLAALGIFTVAACQKQLPGPVFPVRDDVGKIEDITKEVVGEQIVKLEQNTGAEIGVLIVASTGKEDPHAYRTEAHRPRRVVARVVAHMVAGVPREAEGAQAGERQTGRQAGERQT